MNKGTSALTSRRPRNLGPGSNSEFCPLPIFLVPALLWRIVYQMILPAIVLDKKITAYHHHASTDRIFANLSESSVRFEFDGHENTLPTETEKLIVSKTSQPRKSSFCSVACRIQRRELRP